MADEQEAPRPLEGIRVLAVEQFQALPFASAILARLGAEVVKVEAPGSGEPARQLQPSVPDADGRQMSGTFIRNNLNKRSICIDWRNPAGQDLLMQLIGHFDVFAENFRADSLSRLGLGYEDVAATHPRCIYLSLSGFGHDQRSPYVNWGAMAPIAEAISGLAAWQLGSREKPAVASMGPLGDTVSAYYAVIGLLSALRVRDTTGRGQHVDIAMMDSMMAYCDFVASEWSFRAEPTLGKGLLDAFRAADGWFVVVVIRRYQFELLSNLLAPEWISDPRLADQRGWADHADDVIRPVFEAWAATRSRAEACADLAKAGLLAGPCLTMDELRLDPHVSARQMLSEVERPDGQPGPFLVPGDPVKLSAVSPVTDRPAPLLGHDTEDVLRRDLGLSTEDLSALRQAGAIN
jgi:crotonobetainyl-CoA:carnitine CoA-transferase CaiB-like acyl-CoA transferase